MLLFTQWIFPLAQNKLRLRINRNNTAFTVPAIESITLDTNQSGDRSPLIISVGNIAEEAHDEDGFLVYHAVELKFKDSLYFQGVSNGVVQGYDYKTPNFLGLWINSSTYAVGDVVNYGVDERFICVAPVTGGGSPHTAAWEPYYDTVLNSVFRENTYYENGDPLYTVFIERLRADGTYEKIFAGDINPNTIPVTHDVIINPTTRYEVQLQTFTVQADSGATRMRKLKLQPMVDILYTYPSGAKGVDGSDLSGLPEPNRFTQSDMGPWAPFYAGLIPEDINWHPRAPYPTFNQLNDNNPAPYFDHYIFGGSADDQYVDIAALGRFDVHPDTDEKSVTLYATNNWPENTWAIKLSTLLEKLYSYCGFDTTVVITSPFEFATAAWQTTNSCMAPQYPASIPDLYFCYNYFFGVNPTQRFNAGANLPLWRGGGSAPTYDIGAKVADGSNDLSYVSIQAGNFNHPPNSSPAWWAETGDAGSPYPPTWSPSGTYHLGQEVIYASQIWFSEVDNNTAGPPGTILGWTPGYNTGAPLDNWSQSFRYNIGDEVTHDGKTWSSLTDGNTNHVPGIDPGIWALNEDTGSQFSSPVSFAWNQTVGDVITALCWFFGCFARTEIDQTTGKIKLTLESITASAGTLPNNFVCTDESSGQPRKLAKDYLEIKNAGSELAMRSPPSYQGEPQSIQLQWRVRRWGETIANPSGNADIGKAFPLADMMFSSPLYGSAEFTTQGNYCRRHDGSQPNRLAAQGWVLGAHIFSYYAGPAWSASTGYPSTIGNGDIVARNGWEGYYALYGVTEKPGFYGVTSGFVHDRLNNFYAHAQLYHNELLGKKEIILRTYSGVADDTDNWFGVRYGMTMKTQIRGKYREFKAISINRDPTDHSTTIDWVEKIDSTNPTVETPAEFYQGDNAVGNVSSGGGGTAGSSSGSASSARAVVINPANNTQNIVQATASGYTPLVIKRLATNTDDLQEWQDDSGATLANIDHLGNAIINGLTIITKGLSASTSIGDSANTLTTKDYVDTLVSGAVNGFVKKAPSATSDNTIQASGATTVALTLRGDTTTATAHTLDIERYSDGSKQSWFDNVGGFHTLTDINMSSGTLFGQSAQFTAAITGISTVSGDAGNTLASKDYADGLATNYVAISPNSPADRNLVQPTANNVTALTLKKKAGATAKNLLHCISDSNAEYFAVDVSGNVSVQQGTPTSMFHVGGPIATAYVAKAAAYTLTATDSIVRCDAAGGAFTVTLPTAVGIAGRRYTIKRINAGANNVTVACTGGQTIDGAATVVLGVQWADVELITDGANWQKV